MPPASRRSPKRPKRSRQSEPPSPQPRRLSSPYFVGAGLAPPSLVKQGCMVVVPNPRLLRVRDLLYSVFSFAGARNHAPALYSYRNPCRHRIRSSRKLSLLSASAPLKACNPSSLKFVHDSTPKPAVPPTKHLSRRFATRGLVASPA